MQREGTHFPNSLLFALFFEHRSLKSCSCSFIRSRVKCCTAIANILSIMSYIASRIIIQTRRIISGVKSIMARGLDSRM